jgi:hypothetical protein
MRFATTLPFLVVFVLLGSPATTQSPFIGMPAANHVGPEKLYPDPAMTLSKAETVSLDDSTAEWECPNAIDKDSCTYSQSHRAVSKSTHTKVYDEYAVTPAERNIKHGEVDHFDPHLQRRLERDPESLVPAHYKISGMGRTSDFTRKTLWKPGSALRSKRGASIPRRHFRRSRRIGLRITTR